MGALTVKGRFDGAALPVLLSAATLRLSFQRTRCLLAVGGRLYGESRFNGIPLEYKVAVFSRAALLEKVPGDDGQNSVQIVACKAWEGLLDVAEGVFPRGVFHQVQVQRGSELVANLEPRPGLEQQVGEFGAAVGAHHLPVSLLDLDELAVNKGGQFGAHALGRGARRVGGEGNDVEGPPPVPEAPDKAERDENRHPALHSVIRHPHLLCQVGQLAKAEDGHLSRSPSGNVGKEIELLGKRKRQAGQENGQPTGPRVLVADRLCPDPPLTFRRFRYRKEILQLVERRLRDLVVGNPESMLLLGERNEGACPLWALLVEFRAH